MYSVVVYASWDALAKGRIRLQGTFQLRGAAMEAADACAYPIVDVRDIGEAGRCPARLSHSNGDPRGHRFSGEEWIGPVTREPTCRDCQARQADLYFDGTYVPLPPTDALVDGPYYAEVAM
jgi:hypothetical protein